MQTNLSFLPFNIPQTKIKTIFFFLRVLITMEWPQKHGSCREFPYERRPEFEVEDSFLSCINNIPVRWTKMLIKKHKLTISIQISSQDLETAKGGIQITFYLAFLCNSLEPDSLDALGQFFFHVFASPTPPSPLLWVLVESFSLSILWRLTFFFPWDFFFLLVILKLL